MTTSSGDVPILFHDWHGFNSQLVRFTLAECTVEYTSRLLDTGPAHENDSPWYIPINHSGSVPTLGVNNRHITDTHRIINFIDLKFNNGKLTQIHDDSEKASVDFIVKTIGALDIELLSLSHTRGLSGHLQSVALSRRIYILSHLGIALLHKYAETYDDLYDRYLKIIKQVEELREMLNDPIQVHHCVKSLSAALSQFEKMYHENLQHSSSSMFIVGTQFTAADIFLVTLLARLSSLGLYSSLLENCPGLQKYFVNLSTRKSFLNAGISTSPPSFSANLRDNSRWMWHIYGYPISVVTSFAAIIGTIVYYLSTGRLPFNFSIPEPVKEVIAKIIPNPPQL